MILVIIRKLCCGMIVITLILWKNQKSNLDNEFFDLFWAWFRVIESVDLESDQLTNQIKETYFKSVDASKGEHLSVSIAS